MVFATYLSSVANYSLSAYKLIVFPEIIAHIKCSHHKPLIITLDTTLPMSPFLNACLITPQFLAAH